MIHEDSSAMLWARIKIDGKKTEEMMKAVEFTDEEVKKLKKNLVEMFIRYLDEGKGVPIILRGPHTSIDIKFKNSAIRALVSVHLEARHTETPVE